MSWFDDGQASRAVDVPAIMDSAAPTMMWEIVQLGALLSLGTTSDGGALGVTVTLDGRWKREYFRDSEELIEWLSGAHKAVQSAVGEAPSAPTGRRKRSRRPA